jgi:serine/threonine protein kinase
VQVYFHSTFFKQCVFKNIDQLLVHLADALAFLHSLKIIYRDVKSENVLLDGRGLAKLADLGLNFVIFEIELLKSCVILGAARTFKAKQAMTRALGSPSWIAPELFDKVSCSDITTINLLFRKTTKIRLECIMKEQMFMDLE